MTRHYPELNSSRQVAEEALKDFANIAILTVEESYELSRKAFIDPFREAALVA